MLPLSSEEWHERLQRPLADLLASLDEVVAIIMKALLFLLIKVSVVLCLFWMHV